ncbi:E3 ubiquitin-protein ligase Iruka-like isoform X2 [Onthophagus taurus]|uniref:E3 ubiquitin-protein ligase Iruka-like isoform X2 n=1 Tax=Onthophagus taurus TaxID=166361 RepID=UPI000C1FFD28|nr:E3 ubiquitin-protein ligase RNF126-A-like isoform X1 [Onthophagus taurus]
MAEAAVEERTASKFYCHVCNVQFENASANYTCPHCCNGFIEELDSNGDNDEEFTDVTDSEDENYQLFNYGPLRLFPQAEDRRRFLLNPSLRSRYAAVHPQSRQRPRNNPSNIRSQIPFEDLIQEFVVNLGVGVNWGGAGSMVFLGNPGDYAWGHEGLDAVVSQLLNQMDTSGPPPLSKEVIDALPSVDVTESQVNAKLQCSVCWEDFQFQEKVRQLPCQHVYHEPCIRPWLELHGTCPICRQNLVTGEQQNSQDDSQTNPASLALQQLFQVVQQSSGSNSNLSSSAGSSNSSATSSSSSSYNSDTRM